MSEVRYILQDLPSGDFISWDLPLTDVQISEELTAPTVMAGTVSYRRADVLAYLNPYGCAIWADDGSGTLYGGMLTDVSFEDEKAVLSIDGYAAYPDKQPWQAEAYAGVQVDPLDMVRKIFAYLQSESGGDLHIEVDETSSKVRVGTEEKDTEFTTGDGEEVSFTSGPYKLNPWETSDLGKAVADLFEEAGASYLERHWWDGDVLRHRLEIDYPSRAVLREDQRFVVGENVIAVPKVTLPGESYASSVLIVGAGEGAAAIRATAESTPTRLRRAVVIADKSIKSKRAAQLRARAELQRLNAPPGDITEIEVLDHPNARFADIRPGDVINVYGKTEWIDIEMRALVVAKDWKPETPNTGTLALEQI